MLGEDAAPSPGPSLEGRGVSGPEGGVAILHEDAACLVLLKPAGLATQSPRGFDSLERRVHELLSNRSPAEPICLGLPHRLDRPVSGPLLLAKTRRAARKLSRQFERRRIRKIYWAGVGGIVEPANGDWIDFVRKVPDEPRAEIVAPEHPDAQQAVLHYRTLGAIGTADLTLSHPSPLPEGEGTAQGQIGTLLEIELETGRMHQIRVQAAARGHPVIGDVLYGSPLPFGPPPVEERQRLIALHGRSLSFFHPDTQQPLTVDASLPEAWRQLGLPASL